MILMALEDKEKMQKYCEASMRCLQTKALPYNPQHKGVLLKGFPEAKDQLSNQSGGGALEPDGPFGVTPFAIPNDGYQRPNHQQYFHIWPAFHPGIRKAQQNHFYAVESHLCPMRHEFCFPIDGQSQYVPFRMPFQCYRPDVQLQEFQYFVVIDFEATCDKEKNPHPQEIIEFPSVLVNSMTGQLEDYFQIYVRPTHNHLLSDFCKELTGIQQTQVDKGVLLGEALHMHDKWLEEKGIKQTNFAVVTWSNWDCRVMLESECRYKRIWKPPYFNRWINLKVPFNEVFGGVRCNLKDAVQLAGLIWEGRAHCGLDDAKNTARLLSHIMTRGFRFAITNSMWQSAEYPYTVQRIFDPESSSTQQVHRTKHHPHPHPLIPAIQFHPIQNDSTKERLMFCYCGVKTSKQMVRKPGPKHGSFFFGCGNWTATRGALCPYFEWATL